MNQILTLSLASTVLIFSTAQAKAATFMIDDFTTLSSTNSTGGSITDAVTNSGILGGERYIELNHTSGSGNLVAETKQCTDVIPPLECMTFSGDSGVTGSLSVVYGNNTAAALDVTAGGFNDVFRVAIQFADFATDFDVIVTDTLGNTASYTDFTPAGIFFPVTGTSEFDISFDSFSGDVVDFTSLDTLEFSFVNLVPATDLEFSLLTTENIDLDNDPVEPNPEPEPEPEPTAVPEPTPLISLMGLLVFGCLASTQKQKI